MAINPFQAPINYAVDVQSPFEAALGGFKLGAGVAEVEATRAARERALTAQTALGDLFKNPNATAADYARVTAFLPKDQAAIVQQGFEAQTKEQQQNTLKQGAQVYTAIKSGNLPVAQMQLTEQAKALREAGKEKEAQGFDDLSNLIRMNPTGAQATIALTIAGLPGGKEFLENADKALSTQRQEALQPSVLGKSVADANAAVADAERKVAEAKDTPARLKAEQELRVAQADKAKADAATAKVTSEFAERNALAALNLNKAQIENYAAQQDIARQNARIAVMQADAAKESNALKRQELQLKIETAQEARDQSVRDKYSQAQNVLATFDNTLVSVDKILNNWGKTEDGKIDPNLSNRTVKSATGPVQSRIFTTSQDVADFEEQVGALESQAFLSQVEKMRGLGALTEREGARLVNALASLSLRQSPKQLAENLLIVRDLMQKARSSAEAKYGDLQSGAPSTGNSVKVGNETFTRPANFTDAQWSAYKQSVGVK
jgi:hypothetical protein